MEHYEWTQANQIKVGDYLHAPRRVVSKITDFGWVLQFEFPDGMTLAYKPASRLLRRLSPAQAPA